MKIKILSEKLSFLEFLLISILILYTASASILTESDIFHVIVFSFLIIIFFYKKNRIDFFLWVMLLIWGFINLVSVAIINPNMEFSFMTFIGITMRMIMPYFILKIIGPTILEKTLPYVYLLTIISLILFPVQYVFPNIFYGLSGSLNFITQEQQVERGGWYIFIYMFNAWGSERNAGFMWEPGAFSAIVVIFTLYRLATNGYKLDRMVLVFFLAIFTTFSTAGYLALGVILIMFFVKSKERLFHPVNIMLLILLVIGSFNIFMETDFMESKIDRYVEEGTESYAEGDNIRVNRLGIAIIALDYSIHWPFGNGIVTSEYKVKNYGNVTAPNSLITILTQWGWLGLIVFFIYYFKYFKYFTGNNLISYLSIIALSIVLFSNPDSFRYFIYLLFYYAILYADKPNYKDSGNEVKIQEKVKSFKYPPTMWW